MAATWRGFDQLLKADFHIHTKHSMDCDMALEQIISRCQEKEINCIAIADHGTAEGALKMQSIAPFTVIVAEEMLTPHGEIMGMFLKESIPSGLSVEETISRIKVQGALVNIPHPFDVFRQSTLESNMIDNHIEQIDLMEVLNARYFMQRTAVKAQTFAQKNGIPQSAGSDAHTPDEIGNVYLEMPEFNGRDDFLQALIKGKVCGKRTHPLVHFNSAWARLKTNLKKDA
ncbi:PHP-associated domain-containing protein [Chloroflexota bacterium]